MSSDFKDKAANKNKIETSTNKSLNGRYMPRDHEDIRYFGRTFLFCFYLSNNMIMSMST